jgi:hypothetical protein
VTDLAQVLRDHDADRMVCYDHDGLCCPSCDAHDFPDREEHQADAVRQSMASCDRCGGR